MASPRLWLQWLHVLAVAVAFGVAAWIGIELTSALGRVAAIWLSNGLLVGCLLSQQSRRVWMTGACFLANLVVNVWVGDSWAVALALAFANMVEVIVAVRAVRGSLASAADLLQRSVLLRFFLTAVVLAPAISSMLAAAALHLLVDTDPLDTLAMWYPADALGMAVMVPLVMALRPSDISQAFGGGHRSGHVLAFVVLLCVTAAVFYQSEFPFLVMLMPPLLVVAFRLGFVGAALGVSSITALALGFTIAGTGPFTLITEASGPGRIVALQLLIATLIVTTYPVCAVILGHARLLRDIAASEERFRVIAENSSDIVALTDVQGRWRYISPAVTPIFGWRPEELIDRNGMDFVHPDDAGLYAQGSRRLSTGRETLTGIFRMRHRDGHYVWVETSSRLLRDAISGQPTGWVSSTRDISARKRMEQMKTEFISTVNHELRTPLTAMIGAIGLAISGKFGPVPEQITRLLNIVKSNGDRLAALVNDILDFERVSSGKMRFDLQAHPVQAMLEQTVAENRPYAEQHGVTLALQSDIPDVRIQVDHDRFLQVMANLLSNAAKFSNRGSSVEVAAALIDGRCRISVIDHGCGIPTAFRPLLFQRFAQADSSDRRAKGGTGLGMAIAKHMTEYMGGRISFESQENVGTTFHLEFPQASSLPSAASAQ